MTRDDIMSILYNYRKAQLIHVAAKLNIAELLAAKKMKINELSSKTGTDRDNLFRIMRALMSIKIFTRNEEDEYENNENSCYLLEDHPKSVKLDAVMRMDEYNWKPWGGLFYSVKTGKNAFKKVFNKNLFEYLAENPESGKTFHEAMSLYTKYGIESFIKNYNFTGIKKIADIGGSSGILMKSILDIDPGITGILFDLPELESKAVKFIQENNLGSRCRIITGDFFKAVPENCDLYILKKIIHDWDDEKSLKILRNCYDAAPRNGRILLLESVIVKRQLNPAIMMNDIHMLVQTDGGRERTEDEYTRLLNKAGFDVIKITERYAEGVKK
jgi:hypothetical protein